MTRYIATTEVKEVLDEKVLEEVKKLFNTRCLLEIHIIHTKDYHYNITAKNEELGME